jgi:hypothetical protein
MRACKPAGGIGDAEVSVLCVGAQAIGPEILFAMVADRNLLLRPRALCGRRRSALACEFSARGGFGCGLSRRRFLMRGALGCRA